MGSLTPRKRKDGSIAYTAQIRIKRDKKVVHQESQTFERSQAAKLWMKKREAELAEPGALDRLNAKDPTLADVIDQYVKESRRDYGKTKKQVLRTIKGMPIGAMKCSEIGSAEIMAFAQSLKSQPQTVGNYLSHLAAVFAVARPAWGYPLDKQAVDDARTVAQRMGVTSRSNRRDRRPTLDELDKLMGHYGTMQRKRADAIPMQDIILFAIYSTRRLDEIVRARWDDLDDKRLRMLVRDLKHPGEKIGNNQWCDLPEEALKIARLQDKHASDRMFPYNGDSISASFTRACQILGIDDLHFHDLRHHGISRLFEMGLSIPRVAAVSGHRTWTSLKRYTHLSQDGDCMANFAWPARLASVTAENSPNNRSDSR